LAFFGGILIGGIGTFFVYKKLRQSDETELVSSLLSKSERAIIKAINADNGISTQKRICEKTGFSKSKVSQILSKLEEKGVLERERWGRTNKVTLIESTFQELGVENTSEKELEEND
ncbi:MAG: winged helix-turn-helix transcriptional regulator, partial [Candidatus Heimdallarchaeota archaeon]|nr:winged helix-turn-helix transcriptional regulator [Candidatus Heimdallarchaeota archaeon]